MITLARRCCPQKPPVLALPVALRASPSQPLSISAERFFMTAIRSTLALHFGPDSVQGQGVGCFIDTGATKGKCMGGETKVDQLLGSGTELMIPIVKLSPRVP
jgi:hypothetical protein